MVPSIFIGINGEDRYLRGSQRQLSNKTWYLKAANTKNVDARQYHLCFQSHSNYSSHCKSVKWYLILDVDAYQYKLASKPMQQDKPYSHSFQIILHCLAYAHRINSKNIDYFNGIQSIKQCCSGLGRNDRRVEEYYSRADHIFLWWSFTVSSSTPFLAPVLYKVCKRIELTKMTSSADCGLDFQQNIEDQRCFSLL